MLEDSFRSQYACAASSGAASQSSLARDFGWQRLTNGELLDAAEKAGFDLVLTCDQNYAYQQSFRKRKIAVVILSSNRWPQIEPLTPRIRQAVDLAQKGQITHIDLAAL